jgi:4-amino-4-deoxy-L-arabinose transferase-like glycosyltransferase
LQAFLSVLWGAVFALAIAYSLGAICFRSLPLPAVVRLGLGAVIESLLIFFLFLFGWGTATVFLVGGVLSISTLIFLHPVRLAESPTVSLDLVSRWIFFPIRAVYAVLYLVHAMAPEIQPDAVTYHLGLTAEYLRLGAFSNRIGFYEVLPQGMEMLFAAAFAFGRHSAAGLLHFSFLLATVRLMVLICRRLKFPDLFGFAAAILYLATPVAGVTGTSAYTDAGLVFFHLAAFYLLLLWRDENRAAYAFAAGLAAGFCFAVKFTGLLAPPLALLFILSSPIDSTRRRIRDALWLTAGATLIIAPWMLRDLVLTGNPLAPLFNAWFPNEFFSASAEQALSQTVRTYDGFRWVAAPWNWAFGGRLQGIAGPLIFLFPLAFLAWRKPAARVVLCAGLLLLTPLLYNVGTRFLMPALPLLALALVLALPRPAVWAVVALQAVVCFPPVIAEISGPNTWMLHGFPWRAALRIQPEAEYLEATMDDYLVSRLVETRTQPTDRIFALVTLANAYTTRGVLQFWHSSRAVQLTDALNSALVKPVTVQIQADWPPASLSALRVVTTAEWSNEWRIFEARLASPGGFISPGPQWFLKASPNLWEAPRAFDGNRTTYWSSRSPEGPGMFLEVDFDRPQIVSSIELLSERTKPAETLIVQGLPAEGGKWRLLADGLHTEIAEPQDLRREAVRALKDAGFTYVLVSSEGQGAARIGKDMWDHPVAWGVEDVESIGPVHLFRLL